MRLLDVRTLELRTFDGDEIPPYAILSHTWLRDEEEVTHAQIQDPENCRHMLGFQKIRYTCQQAIKGGLGHAWIDTCCIDKTNSTELSEAINSMFRWYSKSRVCYVYLKDVLTQKKESLVGSTWWTRAWTLQELLAPTDVQFYNVHWQRIGPKTDLISIITSVTGIDQDTLYFPMRMFDKSIAQRLSWAAGRKAKRTEDRAYSMLGILGVSMAMQYGEGSGAFTRLQEAILQDNNDQTLFAWHCIPRTLSEFCEENKSSSANAGYSSQSSASLESSPEVPQNSEDRKSQLDQIGQNFGSYLDESCLEVSQNGLFAKDPDSFRYCGRIIFHSKHALGSDLIKLNGAWRVNMPLVHLKTQFGTYQVGLLPCSHADRPYHLLAIMLQSWNGGNRYQRIGPGKCVFTFLVDFSIINDAHTEQLWVDGSDWLFLHRKSLKDKNMKDYRSIKIRIKTDQDNWHFLSAEPRKATWSSSDMVLQLPSLPNHYAVDSIVMAAVEEQVLLSFKYATGSQINFALQLPILPDMQLPDPEDAFKSRVLVFAGDKKEEDWAVRLEQVLDRLLKASSITPDWSIQASVTTRRVFNQLISTLEITDTKSALDTSKLREEMQFLRSQGEPESEIDRVVEDWHRLHDALHACDIRRVDMRLLL